MEWSDALSVGIGEIDFQHKKLIVLINNLHDAVLAGKGKQGLEKTLQELAGYAVTHFKFEEDYMQKFSYPMYRSHKEKHDAFVQKVTDFHKDYENNRIALNLAVMNFMKEWVTGHIQGEDKGYVGTFIQGGLK